MNTSPNKLVSFGHWPGLLKNWNAFPRMSDGYRIHMHLPDKTPGRELPSRSLWSDQQWAKGSTMRIDARVKVNILSFDPWSRRIGEALQGAIGTVTERRPDDWVVTFDNPVQNPNGGPPIRAFGFEAHDLEKIG